MNDIRFRSLVAFASLLVIWCASAPKLGVAECSVCNLTLTHRTGPVKVSLTTTTGDGTSGTYATTGSIPVRLQIANLTDTSVQLPKIAERNIFSIHIVSDAYKATEKDLPLPKNRPEELGAHQTFTFPVSDIRGWGWGPEKPGTYNINFSYDNVDSNEVTIVVADK